MHCGLRIGSRNRSAFRAAFAKASAGGHPQSAIAGQSSWAGKQTPSGKPHSAGRGRPQACPCPKGQPLASSVGCSVPGLVKGTIIIHGPSRSTKACLPTELSAVTGEKANAFSLVELLVVVAVIAILVVLLVPTVRNAVEYAHDTTCKSNLHFISQALHMGESGLPAASDWVQAACDAGAGYSLACPSGHDVYVDVVWSGGRGGDEEPPPDRDKKPPGGFVGSMVKMLSVKKTAEEDDSEDRGQRKSYAEAKAAKEGKKRGKSDKKRNRK